jgi:hypothetical protein
LAEDYMKLSLAKPALISYAAIALLVAAGCSSSTSPATTTVVGTYTLKTADGVNLPAPAKDPTGAVAGTWLNGSATLNADNTYTSTLNYKETNGNPGSLPGSGTYSSSGSTVTLTAAGGGSVTNATFSGGNTLTSTVNGQTMVFKK